MTYEEEGENMTGKERSVLEKLLKREKERQILPENGDRLERAPS
jgi:hypothetical protein